MSDWVWIIGAGVFQIPLIKEAQKRGFRVLVSDKNPKAPGVSIADSHVEISTYDIRSHVSLAQHMKIKPKAVLTAGADVGPTVSAVAEVLNLPAESLDIAEKCRNKFRVREALKFPHPIYTTIKYYEATPNLIWKNWTRTFDVAPYPCVIKPLENCGSRGISLVKAPWKLDDAIQYARKHNRNSDIILMEEYLIGPEVSLDFFAENERLIFANGSWRKFSKKYFGLEVGFLNPWEPPDDVRELCKLVKEKLGITWGPLKIDLKCDPRYGWVVMEVATRLSGGYDHNYAAPLSTGKDITGVMLDIALGGGISRRKLGAKKSKYVFCYSPVLKPGKVKSWKKPKDIQVFERNMEYIKKPNDCSDRNIFLMAVEDTPFQAYKKAIKGANELEVKYER